jgi:hypothetical protein
MQDGGVWFIKSWKECEEKATAASERQKKNEEELTALSTATGSPRTFQGMLAFGSGSGRFWKLWIQGF